jgi:Fe-S cluster assembly scaffold protein SufB
LDRINVLKVSNEYFGITKSLYVKQAPAGGNKVSLDTQFYDTIYSATALWDEFHYINFIANNDYIIHEEARIRLRQSQFVSLQNNNYIFTNNKWCEVLRIEWIDEKSAATITYKEPLDWANGKVTLLKIN